MSEDSKFWNGVATGDAVDAPYDADTVFSEYMLEALGHGSLTNKGGVLASELNQLFATAAAQTVTVQSGNAFVYGTLYKNTGTVALVLPIPAASTRVDLIVPEKDWLLKTIRLTRIPGVEGGGAPALNQSVGSKWDIPLWQASITTGGIVTLSDSREFLVGSGGGRTGDIQFSFRSTAPSGWASFYGQTVNATTPPYLDLYNWASGEGFIGAGKLFTGTQAALVFADLRSTALIPQDKDPAGNARGLIAALSAIGKTAGEATHALIAGEIPTLTASGVPSGQTVAVSGGTTSVGTHIAGGTTDPPAGGTDTFSVTGGSVTTTTSGTTGTAHNTVQPSIATNVFVKL